MKVYLSKFHNLVSEERIFIDKFPFIENSEYNIKLFDMAFTMSIVADSLSEIFNEVSREVILRIKSLRFHTLEDMIFFVKPRQDILEVLDKKVDGSILLSDEIKQAFKQISKKIREPLENKTPEVVLQDILEFKTAYEKILAMVSSDGKIINLPFEMKPEVKIRDGKIHLYDVEKILDDCFRYLKYRDVFADGLSYYDFYSYIGLCSYYCEEIKKMKEDRYYPFDFEKIFIETVELFNRITMSKESSMEDLKKDYQMTKYFLSELLVNCDDVINNIKETGHKTVNGLKDILVDQYKKDIYKWQLRNLLNMAARYDEVGLADFIKSSKLTDAIFNGMLADSEIIRTYSPEAHYALDTMEQLLKALQKLKMSKNFTLVIP